MHKTMQKDALSEFIHTHVFDGGSHAAERGTRLVTWITLIMMMVELAAAVVDEIREVVEADVNNQKTHLVDLHVWRVGQGAYSCALTAVTSDATLTPAIVRDRLAVHEEIVHSTIEIHYRASVPA